MKIELFPDKNCARINNMTMTFYVFNLAITCYVIPDVIRYRIGWTKSSINRLLKKFRDTDTVHRRQGSGRTSPELTAQFVKYHGDRHS